MIPEEANRERLPRNWHHQFFEHSPVLIFIADNKGSFLDINDAGVKMLAGESRNELIDRRSLWSFFTDQADQGRFRDVVSQSGFVRDFETPFQRMDGKRLDVSITGRLRLDEKGGSVGYEGIITDITERKKTENSLKESIETYRTAVDNCLAAITIHQDGRHQFVNRYYAEMLGYDDPSELTGKPFWITHHPEDSTMVRDRGLLREKKQFLPNQYVFRQMKKDKKTIVWVQVRATHTVYMGRPAAVTSSIDITPSKRAEEEIRNLLQRLVKVREEERKKIAADLHDEMGQILTAMHFKLEALNEELPVQSSEQKELCDTLIENVKELADKARKIMIYLRRDIPEHAVLISVLEGHVLEFKEMYPEIHVDFQYFGFKKRLDPEIEIVIYRILQEGLTNIVKHAQASRVEIILTYSHPRVILTIRDNGIGFEGKQGEDQTESSPKGIGLISMRDRVAFFGGILDITSAPGQGTVIRANIPV